MASPHAQQFRLDPTVTFLNHGSFGACPSAVLAVQQDLRDRMEREPVRFFVRDLEPLLDEARADLAAFIGADANDLAFVANATTGVNAVLRSLSLAPGDELLTTDHTYNACHNALEFAASRTGAQVVIARVPFPIRDPAEVTASLIAKAGPRTRLALVDHVTSPTGLVFPIADIIRELDRKGIDTLVDGAHAPGMLPLALNTLAAAYYTGNCHKWLCAPKGAGFLHVRRDRQKAIRPTVISHGANSPRSDRSRFRVEFDWTGTLDPTAFLTVPAAIRWLSSILPGGIAEVMSRNHALALSARDLLARALGVTPPAPDAMLGALASLPLPEGTGESPKPPFFFDALQDALYEEFRIEVPVVPWPAAPKRLIRISAQLYNDRAQYEELADALITILGHASPNS